ncbi:hypothetical protein Vafri_3035 [Volvox africanus]|uniref:Chitin-binding type-2 domain-containing protein n=1 Tax=Volvox africanus TaxID=51714 RepID=A0A8J4AR44_9CHLO|nr:hypothetical protein Vafri_3035 [Volvox africanus]
MRTSLSPTSSYPLLTPSSWLMSTSGSRIFLLGVVIFLSTSAISVYGHGFLQSPLSRARAVGRAEWEAAGGNGLGLRPFRTYPDTGFLVNDRADVCGDPHQDVGDLNMRSTATAIQATYTAGQTITVSYRMTVNHGGWLSVKICPTTRVNPSQACFDGYTLTNANTGFARWWIQTGAYGTQTTYTTNWRLPVGVSCDSGCVLQITYRTANSCVDPCNASECGTEYAAGRVPVSGVTGPGVIMQRCGTYGNPSTPPRTEVFRDCADIRIVASGGSNSGTTTRSSPPPPPTQQSSSGGGTQTPTAFCSGKANGFYGDKSTNCAKYFWCYGSGAAYMSCAAGTTMDSRGTKNYCDYPKNNVC